MPEEDLHLSERVRSRAHGPPASRRLLLFEGGGVAGRTGGPAGRRRSQGEKGSGHFRIQTRTLPVSLTVESVSAAGRRPPYFFQAGPSRNPLHQAAVLAKS
jgi:hypothetical protein